MRPSDGVSRPASRPSNVDFPDPETPIMAMLSRDNTAKLISSRMFSGPLGPWTVFDTRSTSMIGRSIGIVVASLILAAYACSCPEADAAPGKKIVVLGDSLSAGYGIALAKSWPSLLTTKLKSEGYPYRVVNASISGDTTRGGARRIGQLLEKHKPQVVIIALGANDGLRGFEVEEIEKNLTQIIAATVGAQATPVLVRIRIPPNYGLRYTVAFEEMFDRLSAPEGTISAPFLLGEIGDQLTYFSSRWPAPDRCRATGDPGYVVVGH